MRVRGLAMPRVNWIPWGVRCHWIGEPVWATSSLARTARDSIPLVVPTMDVGNSAGFSSSRPPREALTRTRRVSSFSSIDCGEGFSSWGDSGLPSQCFRQSWRERYGRADGVSSFSSIDLGGPDFILGARARPPPEVVEADTVTAGCSGALGRGSSALSASPSSTPSGPPTGVRAAAAAMRSRTRAMSIESSAPSSGLSERPGFAGFRRGGRSRGMATTMSICGESYLFDKSALVRFPSAPQHSLIISTSYGLEFRINPQGILNFLPPPSVREAGQKPRQNGLRAPQWRCAGTGRSCRSWCGPVSRGSRSASGPARRATSHTSRADRAIGSGG